MERLKNWLEHPYIVGIICPPGWNRVKVAYKRWLGPWTMDPPRIMSGSCHLDRASNVEIAVECQIFVIVILF